MKTVLHYLILVHSLSIQKSLKVHFIIKCRNVVEWKLSKPLLINRMAIIQSLGSFFILLHRPPQRTFVPWKQFASTHPLADQRLSIVRNIITNNPRPLHPSCDYYYMYVAKRPQLTGPSTPSSNICQY